MSHQRRVLFFDVSKNSSTHPWRPQRRTRDRSRRVASSTASANARRIRSWGVAASTGVLFPLNSRVCESHWHLRDDRIETPIVGGARHVAIDDLTARIAQPARPSQQLRALACRNGAHVGGCDELGIDEPTCQRVEPIEQLDRLPVVVRGGGVEQVEAGMVADPEELGHVLKANR